jgi:hypothetical protein
MPASRPSAKEPASMHILDSGRKRLGIDVFTGR